MSRLPILVTAAVLNGRRQGADKKTSNLSSCCESFMRIFVEFAKIQRSIPLDNVTVVRCAPSTQSLMPLLALIFLDCYLFHLLVTEFDLIYLDQIGVGRKQRSRDEVGTFT